MSKKVAIAVITGLGIVVGTAVIAGRAKAAPEVPLPPPQKEYILTPSTVLAAKTMGELDVYYMYMSQLYITGKIDRDAYEELYQAYVTRFYQLTGFEQ